MSVTYWHKPNCSTSRNGLALLREHGLRPTVVDYIRTGWDEATLARLAAATGVGLRGLLRVKEPAAAALIADEADDAAILAAMIADPVLVERPILETARGVRIGRPLERLLEII